MLNALVLVAALRRLGIFDFRLIVLGDDSVIALKVQVQVGPFVKILAKFGLVAVTVLHPDPDLVTFCSGRFWRTTVGRVWGPKIGRTLAKIGYSVQQQHKPEAWLKGVLLGIKQDTAHVPLLSEYVNHCLKLLDKVRAKTEIDEYKFHVSTAHKSVAATYEQFYKAYGLQPFQYDSMKADILAIKKLPHLLDNPLFEELAEVDC
jgi:hypothetical protein